MDGRNGAAAGGGRTSLPTRALAGVAALLVLVIVGVAIGVWLILDLRQATTRFTEREVQYAHAVGELALVSKAMANDERGFLISGGSRFLDQFDGRMNHAREAFGQALAAADREQWQATDRARATFDQWQVGARANMAKFAAGDEEAAIEVSLGEIRDLRKEYESRLAGMQGLADFAIENASVAVSAALGRSVAILVGYLIVAVTVGVVIAVWLVRTILRPAHDLLGLLDEAEGPVRPHPREA